MTGSPGNSDTALVLSGGGARASYQVGVLAALAERAPNLQLPIVTGVSAGAINAAFIAGHPGPLPEAVAQLRGAWLRLTPDTVYRVKTVKVARWALRLATQFMLRKLEGLNTVRGLMDMRPLSRFLAGVIDFGGIDANVESGRLRAVALTATSYTSGQTVTFVQGGPNMTMWERVQRTAVYTRLSLAHVMASSAIPLILGMVKIGDAFYVSSVEIKVPPLSPAVHLGAQRIIAISTRYARSREQADRPVIAGYPPPAQVAGVLFNAIFLDQLDGDALELRRINDLIERLPDSARDGFRTIDLLMLRPSVDLGQLANEYEPELPRAFRFLTRGLGTKETRSNDMLSLVMFQSDYVRRLIDLGEADAAARLAEIRRFLGAGN